MLNIYICLVLLYCGSIDVTHSFGYDYTVKVPSGRKECYYQPIAAPTMVEFEYQVNVKRNK